jgi:predicted Zn-dependent peptidase
MFLRVHHAAVHTGLTIVLTVGVAMPARAAKHPTSNPAAAPAPAEEHLLHNGMKLVLVPRHLSPTVAGGWVAHVGSANEHPGITGISHLFEHMMFKGTHVIGTRDDAKDARLIDEQEALQAQMRDEMSKLRLQQRRGEIDDMTKPENKTPRYRQLEAKFDSLVVEQRNNMVKNEFDGILQKNGATGINAFTNEDQTFYFESVPSNKLELWFWMEADRIQNRVFREFYSERDVVFEERRLRTESTPTGKFEESFDAIFWEASPYHCPVVGWPSDLAYITKAEADEYYSLYYAPQNLTAILVGDFDPQQALALAEKYLGAIPAGTRPAPEMITVEKKSLAEKRFYGEAETNPSITVRWHTVAFQHKDTPTFAVLEGLLQGDTGRLRRDVVLGAGPATRASANNDSRKYEGLFEIDADCKDGHTPEEVEQAVLGEIEKLKSSPVTAEELQSAKNRYLTGTYRQLTSNFQVLRRLGVAEGRGTWQDADRIDHEAQNVTAADIQRVAQAYFTKENRAVAIWTRKAGGEAEDPAIAALPDRAKNMVHQMLARIQSATDPAQVQQILTRLDNMGDRVGPEGKPGIDYVRAKAQKRLAELGGANAVPADTKGKE